ncbi:MAG: transcriptional regulator [Desulfobacteraceae bacterium IS3]|nr:MAG: transcriptional regulator [Desulfobacteraceae bacterium IS3]HAO20585.1 transcriptional regulator [Desulfobacteraceae bacterium]
MPHISMFFGIIIRMFHNEHPPPHFHAEYQGQKGLFDFRGDMLKGSFRSKTALKLIKKWTLLHEEELIENWKNVEKGKQLDKIAPLD